MPNALTATNGGFSVGSRASQTATIANGASVSASIDLTDTSIIGIIMPAAWTTAALTIEVSADNVTFVGLAYDDLGAQANVISSPVASSAYALNLTGLLPYKHARLRSGTTASPVNQGAERLITVITRPLV